MKKINSGFSKFLTLAFFIVLFSCSGLQAAVKGLPFKDDQYAHFFQGAWVAEVAKSNRLEWWQSGLVVLGLSVAKELYDTQSTGFSSTDIACDLVGALVSYSIPINLFGGEQAATPKKAEAAVTAELPSDLSPESELVSALPTQPGI